MKFTQFYIKSEPYKGKVVLCNTMNESIVVLENEVLQSIEQNMEELEKYPEVKNYLIDNEFVIKDDIDEENNYMTALQNEHHSFGHLSVHILPTTACNFNCIYCYQSGIERHHFLSPEKIDKIICYLENHIRKNPYLKTATFILHGGEPTVNWKVVPDLMNKLDHLAKAYHINYRTQIVTNGYLLTEEKSRLLSQYHWQRLQVTIDGPEEIHNSRRLLNTKKGSYSQIIKNLKYIQDNDLIEDISIRLNFDNTNYQDIINYLPKLKEIFGTEHIKLSLGYISDTYKNTEAENFISSNILKDQDMVEAYCKLYKAAIEVGFEMPDLFMLEGMCTAKLDNAFVISPNGDIFKCLSGVGRKEFVESTLDENKKLDNYLYLELYKKCFEKKCKFIPLCNSGCRFNGFLKTGSKKSNDCQKILLDELNKKLLSIKYLQLEKE